METKILVPVDGSATSAKTVQAILALKERFPCPLTLLHVVDLEKLAYRMIPDFQVAMVREAARKAGEQLLGSQKALFDRAGMPISMRLEFGSPRESICRIANEEDYQLLIIGRRGLGEIRDILFGSVANYVLHQVRCPVLLF